MSWDADLYDDRGHLEHEANYTHNTNGMIAAALEAIGMEKPHTEEGFWRIVGPEWWKQLDGMSGEDGVKYLQSIIDELEREPAKYRAMNPENGWGDYNGLLAVLKRMRDSTPTDWPTQWRVSG